MKILAITQARIGSSRLPGKILMTIKGESLLEIHLKRVLESKLITKLKVATTTEKDSDKIVSICNRLGIDSHKGSLNNVLKRFYDAAYNENPDWIVRLTSDCPFIDSNEIDRVIKFALERNLDYASNTLSPTFPDGLDTEVFKYSALKRAYNEASLDSEIEHVTPFIWKNSTYKGGKEFISDGIMNSSDLSDLRLTVDTLEDFQVIEKLVDLVGMYRPWMDYVNALQAHPEIIELNKAHARNEGYKNSLNKDN